MDQWNGLQLDSGSTGATMGPTLFAGYASTSDTAPTSSNAPGSYTGPGAGQTVFGEPVAVLVGIVAMIALLKFLSERVKSGLNPADLRISGYNIFAVGLTSVVFIIFFKLLANKMYIPGVTDLANAI